MAEAVADSGKVIAPSVPSSPSSSAVASMALFFLLLFFSPSLSSLARPVGAGGGGGWKGEGTGSHPAGE